MFWFTFTKYTCWKMSIFRSNKRTFLFSNIFLTQRRIVIIRLLSYLFLRRRLISAPRSFLSCFSLSTFIFLSIRNFTLIRILRFISSRFLSFFCLLYFLFWVQIRSIISWCCRISILICFWRGGFLNWQRGEISSFWRMAFLLWSWVSFWDEISLRFCAICLIHRWRKYCFYCFSSVGFVHMGWKNLL